MSVAHARDLLTWLAANPDQQQALMDAESRDARRAILNDNGFGDVSGDDVMAAIGSNVLGQNGAGLASDLNRVYVQVVIAADGCPPCSPPIDPEASAHGT